MFLFFVFFSSAGTHGESTILEKVCFSPEAGSALFWHLGFYSVCKHRFARFSRSTLAERNAQLQVTSTKRSTNVVSNHVGRFGIKMCQMVVWYWWCCQACFVLRFAREAKLCQMEFPLHPHMVSLPLDARRAKCKCSFDCFSYCSRNFAFARCLLNEMRIRK